MPPEVEIAGLDPVEYEPDLYLPEVASTTEMLVDPDGRFVPAAEVIESSLRDEVIRR